MTVRRSWRRELPALLSDLRLAIALLLAIASFSILGTVIEQGQPPEFYRENYPEHPALFGFLTYKVLLGLGLDRVFGTWWYLSLLLLFGASLLACTLTRQWPILKMSRRWFYYTKPESFAKFALKVELRDGSLDGLAASLQRRGYRVFREQGKLYARKGLIGRVGPIVVHASMLLILAGAVWGALTGFVAQEMVPSGESFQVQNVTGAGPWAHLPREWSVKVNRFWIDYLPDGKIDQFYSDLSVLDRDGQEVERQTIWVNKPLRYRGVTFYQASWEIAALRFTLNDSPVLELPMAKLQPQSGLTRQVWGTWIPTKPDLSAGVTLITPDLQGTFLLYGSDGQLLSSARVGQAVTVNGIALTIREVVGSTGLQIKADPGIPVVYAGFGLLMVGVLASYVSYSQVWGLQAGNSLYVGGKTNRAIVGFESEFLGIVGEQSRDATPCAAAES